jgi:hypothetical protein
MNRQPVIARLVAQEGARSVAGVTQVALPGTAGTLHRQKRDWLGGGKSRRRAAFGRLEGSQGFPR